MGGMMGGAESMFFQTGADGGSAAFGGEEEEADGPPAAEQMHTVRLVKGAAGIGCKVDRRNAVIGLTPGGAAEKAGLREGDVVWAVDGRDLAPGERLATRLGSDGTHTLRVAYMHGEEGQAHEVRMARPESGGLGLRVDADNVVSKIISGGAAAVDGRLRLGDRILAVNGQSLKGKKLGDVLAGLQPSAKRLTFRLMPRTVAPAPRAQRRRGGGARGGGGRGDGGGDGGEGGGGGADGNGGGSDGGPQAHGRSNRGW